MTSRRPYQLLFTITKVLPQKLRLRILARALDHEYEKLTRSDFWDFRGTTLNKHFYGRISRMNRQGFDFIT
jgi:hypothetical protein